MTARPAFGRPGFALPVAIFALVLLSALVAGALFISTEELRAGRSDLAGEHAFATSELALDRAAATWDARLNTSLPIGASTVIERIASTPSESVTVVAFRAQSRAVWLTSQATSRRDGRNIPARRAVAASLRLVSPSVPIRAALTTAGPVVVDGGVVDGRDVPGIAADTGLCTETTVADAAGIAVPDSTLVCGATCGSGTPSGVSGSPPVTTPGLTSDSGGVTSLDTVRQAYLRNATAIVPGGRLSPRPTVVAGECDRNDPLNWGDLARPSPCAAHYPVIRVLGDATLAAGSAGQGVLVVDGSLSLETGARFAGIVMVTGTIQIAASGAELSGVVFAAGTDAANPSRIVNGGAIRFAGCAARRASLGAARLVRTPARWWAELR